MKPHAWWGLTVTRAAPFGWHYLLVPVGHAWRIGFSQFVLLWRLEATWPWLSIAIGQAALGPLQKQLLSARSVELTATDGLEMCLVQLESDSFWLQLLMLLPTTYHYASVRFDGAVCNVWNAAGAACSAGQLKLLNIGRCFAASLQVANTMAGLLKMLKLAFSKTPFKSALLDSGQRTADTVWKETPSRHRNRFDTSSKGTVYTGIMIMYKYA